MFLRAREIVLVALIELLFRVLRSTWRIEEDAYSPAISDRLKSGEPVVFAHLHEDEWALLGAYSHRDMAVLVSMSRDGNLMSRFLQRLGFEVVRGSPSRNAVAGFRGLIRRVQALKVKAVSLAVDGPKGPRRKAKRGIVRLAAGLESPIVVGSAHADRAWVFRRSWSKAFIPKPFARIRLAYAEVIQWDELKAAMERDSDDGSALAEIERRLLAAKKLSKEAF